MLRPRVTLLRVRLRVAVGLDLHGRSAVAKVPNLTTVGRSKRADFKSHRVARPDAERRRVAGVNGRRKIVRPSFLQYLHDGEVIGRPSSIVRNLQRLAISSRLVITPLDLRALRSCAVGESPFVLRDLPGGTPRTSPIQKNFFSDRRQMRSEEHTSEL